MNTYIFTFSDEMEEKVKKFQQEKGRDANETVHLALSLFFMIVDVKTEGAEVLIRKKIARKWRILDIVLPPKYTVDRVIFPTPKKSTSTDDDDENNPADSWK